MTAVSVHVGTSHPQPQPPAGLGEGAVEAYLRDVQELVAATTASVALNWDDALGKDSVAVLGGVPLSELLLRAVRTPGKRLRPTLAYWGWVAAGGDQRSDSGRARDLGQPGGGYPSDLVALGAALELLHLFALIHDDVMDEAPARRGEATVHAAVARAHRCVGGAGDATRFGDSIAVLIGDAAHAMAEHLAADLPVRVRRLWRATVLELVAGQSLDLVGATERRADGEHAARIAWLKSGAYTVARPLAMGAALAAPEAECPELTEYGRRIGLAFALRDDLLGVWGDEAATGKPTGSDLLQGKATLVLAMGRDRLTGRPAGLLELAAGARLVAECVPDLVLALEQAGVRTAIEALIEEDVRAGVAALRRTGRLSAAGVDGLTRLADRVAWRDR